MSLALILMGAGIFVIMLRPISPRAAAFMPILRVLIFVFLGAGISGLHGEKEKIPPVSPGEYHLEGEVIMAEVLRGDRQRIRFRPSGLMPPDLPRGDLRLIVPADLAGLPPGARLWLKARLQPLLPKLLPGGFDFTAHARAQGYVGTGFVQEIDRREQKGSALFPRLRHAFQERLNAVMDPAEAGVASALLVGLRGGISPDLRETFRASGLSHLLAISGLHMVLFCGGVLVAVRAGLALMPVWSSRFPSLKIAAVTALPFGAIYLLMAGAPVSAVRAFGMMAMMIFALLINRRSVTLHHVALVAMLILAVDPASLYEPAFQMSFAAVFALVGGWTHLHRYSIGRPEPGLLRVVTKPLFYIGGVMMASLLASLASAPFVLHHFGVTTAWSLLGNILGMPLMAFIIMPAGAAALLLAPLGLDALPLEVMGLGIRALVHTAQYAEGLPYSRLSVTPATGLVLVLYTFSMVALIAGTVSERLVALPALVLTFVIWVFTPAPDIAFTSIYGRPHAIVMTEARSALTSRKSMGRFAQSVMLRPFPLAEAQYAPESDQSTCQFGYCLIPTSHDTTTAVIWRQQGFAEACDAADIVISHVRAERGSCDHARIIVTPTELERDGGILIRIEQNGLIVRKVNTGG
ncbi:ComEC/Rec2 family competence protein [Alphaproteobacteria bacterium LSUCC0684]